MELFCCSLLYDGWMPWSHHIVQTEFQIQNIFVRESIYELDVCTFFCDKPHSLLKKTFYVKMTHLLC